MGSRRGTEIEIIDANEEPTTSSRSNKIYVDYDMKGKPIVVEDLTACDVRDDTYDCLGSKRSGFPSELSQKIGKMLGSHDGSGNSADEDEDDEPPSEVNIVKIEDILELRHTADSPFKTEELVTQNRAGLRQWAVRQTGKKDYIASDSAAVHIAPPREVNIVKLEEDLDVPNSADRPLVTQDLLAKMREGLKQQAARQTDKKLYSASDSAVVHVDGIPPRPSEDTTNGAGRVVHRKALLERRLLRKRNALLSTSRGTASQDTLGVDSSTGESNLYNPTEGAATSHSRTTDGRYSGDTSSQTTSSQTLESVNAVRATGGRQFGRNVAKGDDDLTERPDIIHVPSTMDDEACIDLVRSFSGWSNRMEVLDQVASRDIDLVRNTNRWEVLDHVPGRDIDLGRSSSNQTNGREVLDQVPSRDIEMKTSTHQRVADKDFDTESENAVLVESQKEIEDDDTHNAVFSTGETEQIRKTSSSEEEEEYEVNPIDIINVETPDEEDRPTKAIGIGHYFCIAQHDPDENSEAAVISEAALPERRDNEPPEIEESKLDAPLVEESPQNAPLVEEKKQDAPEVEEYNQDASEVEEKKQATPEVEEYTRDTPATEENKQNTLEADENDQGTPGVKGNNQDTPLVVEKNKDILRLERSQQENTESDDEPELVQLIASKNASKEIDQGVSELTPDVRKKPVRLNFQDFSNVVGKTTNIDSAMEQSVTVDADAEKKEIEGANARERGEEKESDRVQQSNEETAQSGSKLATANTYKNPVQLGFHASRIVVEATSDIEHNVIQLGGGTNAEEELEETLQGDSELATANTYKKPVQLDFHNLKNVVGNTTNVDVGMERSVIQLVVGDADKEPEETLQGGSELTTANTRKKPVRLNFHDFKSVVGNTTNIDDGMERSVRELVGGDDEDEEDDKNIAGPSTVNTYNRDLALSEEASSDSSEVHDGSADVAGSPVFEIPTTYETEKATEERTEEDNASFYNSDDENAGGSKVSMEESKYSIVDSLESDLELDIDLDLEEDDEMYESFTLPYVVQLLDRSCAWFEERNNSMPCSNREPSLLEETKKWTPPTKKSTITSRKGPLPNKKNTVPNKKRALSSSEQAAIYTTATKPQQPATITKSENSRKKSLSRDPAHIKQDSTIDAPSQNSRPRRRTTKVLKNMRTTKRRTEKTQVDSDPESRLRQLWTIKRQAQKYKETEDRQEHSEDSEQQWSAENSVESAAESLGERFIVRFKAASIEPAPAELDESYVGRHVAHPTDSFAASSVAPKAFAPAEALAARSVSSEAYAESEDPALPSVSPVPFVETEALEARSISPTILAEYVATLSVTPKAMAETETLAARTVAPKPFAETEAGAVGTSAPKAFVEAEAGAVRTFAPKDFAEIPVYGLAGGPEDSPGKFPTFKREGGVKFLDEGRPESFGVSPSRSSRSASAARSASATSKRAHPFPEADFSQGLAQEPHVKPSTRGALFAGGPESMVKPSRSLRRPRSVTPPQERTCHSSAVLVLERKVNDDRLKIAAAEEVVAEANNIRYDDLSEAERLAAIDLAEKLSRRAAALKRRRKKREKRLKDLQELQEMEYNFSKED